MDPVDWMILGAPLICIAVWMVLDKIYRSLDDGWLEDHLQKRRMNE